MLPASALGLEGFGMASVPMNRARALIICTRAPDYLPGRLREAARYLLDRKDATEEERRLATEAIEWLRSKRDETRASSTRGGQSATCLETPDGGGDVSRLTTRIARARDHNRSAIS